MPKKKTSDKKETKAKSKIPVGAARHESTEDSTTKTFPIVGLGASAGGLEALSAFFSRVSENSAMAYVVVVHMTPKQPSMMPELLQKTTRIPVSTAKDGQVVEPNHVYVIPPDKEISVYKGKIQLLDIITKSATLPIDLFLRSLAQEQGSDAAAIILSGTGTDGTLGVREIKANDGLVLVQSEDSAGYDGMPRSAISTGLVDMVLPPEEMPQKLIQYFTHSKASLAWKPTVAATVAAKSDQQEWLHKIFAILRTHTGHDFSVYKVNTMLRRISRRMGLHQIDGHETYVRYLRENPGEVEALFRELLIGVTNFFRDRESFDVLKTDILPGLFEPMPEDATFRAWIPGCSTGEEVYSLAMILRECLDKIPKQVTLQLFGTDIDNYAVDKAREGLFPASIVADVSAVRLKRFFTKEGDFFRIRKEIRDCVVFSVQDVIKDPPFSHLNLLSCRNLLIYLDTEAQKKLLPLFHYTLIPDGILMLGSSETIGGFSKLFNTVDKKWKIFRRREVPQALRQPVDFPSGPSNPEPTYGTAPMIPVDQKFNIAQITQKAILDQFAPTAILIDAKGEILHVQGRTGKYLETPSGPPTQNILDLAREGLRIELSSAIRAAKAMGKQVTRRKVGVKANSDVHFIDMHVCPQQSPKEIVGRLLVVFEDIVVTPIASDAKQGSRDDSQPETSRIAELERELQSTRESHQTTIEELESSNEELKSANEELQSSNEELQSTNEELESSKEELQSLNEELHTINAELHSKVEELSAAHDDMRNLLNSTEIATIFVDNNLRVRRFTPQATTIVNLIQTDIGRPLQHVVANLSYDDMMADLAEVLKNLTPKEIEVQSTKGEWYKMRIMPYRTMDNRIDGAVLTFSFIDEQIKSQEVLKTAINDIDQAWELVRAVFDMNTDPMLVLNKEGKMIIANTAISELTGISQEDIQGTDFFDFQSGISDQTDLKSQLKTALNQGKNFKTEAFEVNSSDGKQIFSIHGRIIKKDKDFPYRILLQFVKHR
jgi:two-component system CheB/CheR fusion protein